MKKAVYMREYGVGINAIVNLMSLWKYQMFFFYTQTHSNSYSDAIDTKELVLCSYRSVFCLGVGIGI